MSSITESVAALPPAVQKSEKRNYEHSAVHQSPSANESNPQVAIWYDSKALQPLAEDMRQAVREKIFHGVFTGMVMYPDNMKALSACLPARFSRVLHVSGKDEWKKLAQHVTPQTGGTEQTRVHVVCSPDAATLQQAREAGFKTCLRIGVNDAASLHASFREGWGHDYLMVAFKDPTNIPLELVIAELHKSNTVLLKEVGTDIHDAVIALGVLELGSDGVVSSIVDVPQFDALARKLDDARLATLDLQIGTVVRTEHLGLGHRACIDTTHMFEPDEGILVGSTSTGGIFCCPEVFHLPYMELRPFRINAASVHSYVFNASDRTSYISELRAGSRITLVNSKGRTREIYVGRVKTEIRPLILIEVRFPDNKLVNIVMQDDWHVRIFSDKATPLNVTELKPGDKVLGYTTTPGRHVGVRVDEHILES